MKSKAAPQPAPTPRSPPTTPAAHGGGARGGGEHGQRGRRADATGDEQETAAEAVDDAYRHWHEDDEDDAHQQRVQQLVRTVANAVAADSAEDRRRIDRDHVDAGRDLQREDRDRHRHRAAAALCAEGPPARRRLSLADDCRELRRDVVVSAAHAVQLIFGARHLAAEGEPAWALHQLAGGPQEVERGGHERRREAERPADLGIVSRNVERIRDQDPQHDAELEGRFERAAIGRWRRLAHVDGHSRTREAAAEAEQRAADEERREVVGVRRERGHEQHGTTPRRRAREQDCAAAFVYISRPAGGPADTHPACMAAASTAAAHRLGGDLVMPAASPSTPMLP